MSMISTSMSSVNQYSSMQSGLYKKLDTDGDGVLTQDEFVAGRPSDVTGEMAVNLYSSIDSEGNGSLSEDQFVKAFLNSNSSDDASSSTSQASSDIAAMMMDIMSSMRGDGPPPPPPSGGDDEESEIFDAMDTNQDGVVSQEEFEAARPDGVSEEDSLALFQSLDTDETGSITLDQFSAGKSEPDADMASSESGAGLTQDLIGKLMDIIRSVNEGYVDTDEAAA